MTGGGDPTPGRVGAMEEITAELGRAYADLIAELADLEADLCVLEARDGSARDVYLRAKRSWNEAVVAMGDTLQRFGPVLRDAS